MPSSRFVALLPLVLASCGGDGATTPPSVASVQLTPTTATVQPATVTQVPASVLVSALRNTIFGQQVDAPPTDLARIQRVGLYMAFKEDGAIWLEVDYIGAVGDDGRSIGRD